MSTLLRRLQERDTTLWPDGNVAASRLGWLDAPSMMRDAAAELEAWAATIDAGTVVLIGMGGSSLGPEVLRAAVGSDRLVVLDTTDPRTVGSVELDDAFVVVSSKSGTTLEVDALLAHCWQRLPDGARFAAITDGGTPLESLARERAFSRIFVNPADVGGRYSVLTYFGLVPAALLGYDIAQLCDNALSADLESAVDLGVGFATAAAKGADKLTIVSPIAYSAFGLWIEQLVAESTGKSGKGCIPVPTVEAEDGADRHAVQVDLGHPLDLAREFMRWEVATSIAGHVLGIDPFDEPNVAESKRNTTRVLDALPLPDEPADDPAGVFEWLAGEVGDGDYVSLHVYLPYGQDDALETLRRRVRDRLGGVPVTIGYGPRFLHSTGQLHKGGPPTIVAVQIVPNFPTANVPVPGRSFDFGTLIAAQAAGDLQSLRDHRRRVLRVGADHLQEVQ